MSVKTIYYGWFIVATTFFIGLVSVGARNGFGVFVIPMEQEFGWSRGTISLAAAISYLVSGVSQPFLGRVNDRLGSRKLILAGLATLGVGTLLLALTNHIIFLILVFGVVMSLAMSGASITTTGALLSRWFHRRRATAMGISTAGSSLGGLIMVPLIVYMIALFDWRMTWLVLGLLVLGLALPIAFVFLRDSPDEMGLLPDGGPQSVDGARALTSGPRRGPLEVEYWREAFRSMPMWQLCGGYFVCGFTTGIISAHFVPFAIEEGFSPATAATAFGVLSGLNFVGVMLAGILADSFGRKGILALVYALRGCAFAAVLLVPGGWGLWSFAVIVGLSWVASVPLTTSLTADVYGVKHIGTLGGIVFTAHQVGGTLSILLGGVLRDLTGSYTVPFAVAGLLLVGASLVSVFIQEKKYSARYQSVSSYPITYT